MKVFPLDNKTPHKYFRNEIRFARLNSPNVVKIVHVENEKSVFHKGTVKQMSYTLMEYAPYGDFYEVITNPKIQKDVKLIRTYFRQLIQGLEYLHSQGITHMDIKLENLLVGEDYSLKIADFDLSHMIGDKQVLARGTKCYRAPEVMDARCKRYSAVDVYSAGIVLFILKSGGIMPHAENSLISGINFYELLYTDNKSFWEKHSQFQKNTEAFELEFRELFNVMTKFNPEERATLEDIKNMKWYKGEVYTNDELKNVMREYLQY
jgi:serine/threonine protein kinase